jgi:DNA-binding NtrC family response regulator
VYLPQTGFATLTRNDLAASLPKGNKERVLVVDDEEALAQLTADSLVELNYDVTVFTSSSSALETFSADPNKFDAIVTDERMSGLTGLMLIKAARELRPEIPSLLMTGFIGDIQVRTKDEHSPNEFLKKPVSMRELALAMERMLLDAP